MTHHEIKIDSHWAYLLATHTKTHELRRDDRDYQTGDTVRFLNPDGRRDWRWDEPLRITHVLKNIAGLEPGWVVLSFNDPEKEQLNRWANEQYELAQSYRRTIGSLKGQITKLRKRNGGAA